MLCGSRERAEPNDGFDATGPVAVFLAAASLPRRSADSFAWARCSAIRRRRPHRALNIGPLYALNKSKVLQFGEFGVVMLLFIIGLELRPVRLWAMRSAIFGLGTAQLAATSIGACGARLSRSALPRVRRFLSGSPVASSTAFALQVLEEGRANKRHGRLAFSVLLFQDLAAIPLIALVPSSPQAAAERPAMDLSTAVLAIGTILGVIIVGRFLLEPALPDRGRHRRARGDDGERPADGGRRGPGHGGGWPIGRARRLHRRRATRRFRIPPSDRGRHRPVRGIAARPLLHRRRHVDGLERAARQCRAAVRHRLGLVAIKAAVLYGLGRWWGLQRQAAVSLGLVVSQGREFAFVLFSAGALAGVIGQPLASLLTLAVSLSMAATPVLLLADEMIRRGAAPETPDYEMPLEATTT